jgi:hypothetical protein
MSNRPDRLIVREDWFPPPEQSTTPAAWTSLLGAGVGVVIGLIIVAMRSRVFGLSIVAIAVIIGVAGFTSESRRRLLAEWFGKLGHIVGTLVAFVTLTPIFFAGFTAARLVLRISGRDPLQLRGGQRRTFWLPSDQQKRKTRYVGSMFVTEPRLVRPGMSWVSVVLLGIGLLVIGELVLRAYGFGNAVLYVADDMAGFYPAGNQDVHRLGGRVLTNELGMRAPSYTPEKPPGVFRILMLGDSTLYGGQYVNQDELYARLLEQKLRQARPGHEIQVFNMGVNGWGPLNKLGFVRKFGTFESDVCVICLPVDDFRRPKIHMWDTPYFRASAPPRLAYEEVLYHLNWRHRNKQQRMSPEDKAKQIELGISAYLDLIKLLRKADCEVLVEVLPSRTAGITGTVSDAEQQLWERFRRALQKEGLDARFPVGLFADQGAEDDLYHDNLHLHVLGHKIYADHLFHSIVSSSAWQDVLGQTVSASARAAEDAK